MGLADKLRDEIIESQKAQTDLVKWKLILVAAIGGAGLGAVPNAPKNSAFLLALIPLVCIYVDAVCFHCEIRIVSIARYFRLAPDGMNAEREYEEHCKKHRTHFALINIALLGASVMLSGLVLSAGMSDLVKTLLGVCVDQAQRSTRVLCSLISIALTATGACGVLGSLLFYWFCRNRTSWLDKALPHTKVPPVWRFFVGGRFLRVARPAASDV